MARLRSNPDPGRPIPVTPPPVPERLLRFDALDWPGGPAGSWQAWVAARKAFVLEHGPRTPLGDRRDLIRGHWLTKAQMPGGEPR